MTIEVWDQLRQIFTHAAMFLLLAFVLTRYLWGPFGKLLDERINKVREEFGKAEAAQKRFETLQTEYEERMRSIEEEARARMNEEVIRANKMREEILQRAQAEAEVIREKSEREIRQQIANARVELKEQIINLTLQATQRLISEQLTEQKHRDLVGSFIERVDTASRN